MHKLTNKLIYPMTIFSCDFHENLSLIKTNEWLHKRFDYIFPYMGFCSSDTNASKQWQIDHVGIDREVRTTGLE